MFEPNVLLFSHMETQQNEVESAIAPLKKVTRLSKCLAMALFIALPFIGGLVGYTYAPEKIVEVERVTVVEKVMENDNDAAMSLAKTVQEINWNIRTANPDITDPENYRKDAQSIAVDVTFKDNSTKRYDLGTAYGCTGTTTQSIEGDKTVLGKVECYYALTGVGFTAYFENGKFIVERGDESAKDGSVQKTLLLEIQSENSYSNQQPLLVTFDIEKETTEKVQITWGISSEVMDLFPANETFVTFKIIPDGVSYEGIDQTDVRVVGDGFKLNQMSYAFDPVTYENEGVWLKSLEQNKLYRVVAELMYQPVSFTCKPGMGKDCIPVYSEEDLKLIEKAKEYISVSDPVQLK